VPQVRVVGEVVEVRRRADRGEREATLLDQTLKRRGRDDVDFVPTIPERKP
jgi:hypothetical protein